MVCEIPGNFEPKGGVHPPRLVLHHVSILQGMCALAIAIAVCHDICEQHHCAVERLAFSLQYVLPGHTEDCAPDRIEPRIAEAIPSQRHLETLLSRIAYGEHPTHIGHHCSGMTTRK